MNSWIGISLGDVTGIGPEVTLKALAAEWSADSARYLLIGDYPHLDRLNQQLGLKLPLEKHSGPDTSARLAVCQPLDPLPEQLTAGAAPAAHAAFTWVREGAERCLRKELAALVTAPVNKHAIVRAGTCRWACGPRSPRK